MGNTNRVIIIVIKYIHRLYFMKIENRPITIMINIYNI